MDCLGGRESFEADLMDHDYMEDSLYYPRAIQANEKMAWGSPTWVDRTHGPES